MLLQKIEKWFTRVKPNVYREEDGFYEVPYLINTPQAFIESWAKLPFCTHDRKAQSMSSTASVYAKNIIHYQEITEGLWVFFADIKFKNNIHFKLSIAEDIPADCYLLAFVINKLPYEANQAVWENSTRDYQSWAIIKPGKAINVNYFKNAHVLFYHISLNKTWFKKNILSIGGIKKSELNAFLASNQDYIIWPTSEINFEPSFDAAWKSIQQKGNQGAANLLELKIHTLKLINLFLTQLSDKEKHKQYFNVADCDRKRVLQVERIIMDRLLTEFPSIEGIANKLNISTTKLKNDFKAQFGMPMYQYYLSKKMAYAKDLLLKDHVLIKNVAHYMGYENIRKFSAAFKKYQGCLPSDVIQQENKL